MSDKKPPSAKTHDLFVTRLYRAEKIVPQKLTNAIEALAMSLAMDDGAGQKWAEKYGYAGYTSYASLNDLPWRFPEFARLVKVIDKILRDLVQPRRRGQDGVVSRQFPIELFLFLVGPRIIQGGSLFCCFDVLRDAFADLGINDLQFFASVFIEQGQRRAIGHRSLKVVDRDVVSEHFTRELLLASID